MNDLPAFVPPMLAKLGQRPFDSEEHVFEPKWDGFRALVLVEKGGWRARSRADRDLAPRFPELGAAAALPPGTALDGELVVVREGRPDFESMLRREQARKPRQVAAFEASLPASFAVFDLLYQDGEALLDLPLVERQSRLAALLEEVDDPRLVRSEGVLGKGVEFFERALELGFEGVVAKRLDSPYLPGRRTDLWTKVKATQRLLCVILGWVPDETGDLRSLVVGTDREGELRCVGRVGSGISEAERRRLRELLGTLSRPEAVVDCGGLAGEWVEPKLFCVVSFLEFTGNGTLRAPVFVELVDDGA